MEKISRNYLKDTREAARGGVVWGALMSPILLKIGTRATEKGMVIGSSAFVCPANSLHSSGNSTLFSSGKPPLPAPAPVEGDGNESQLLTSTSHLAV